MKTFLSGAMALAAATPSLWAGVPYAGNDWLGLDEELNSLASTVNLQNNGTDIGALIRSTFYSSSDFDGGTGEDLLGLALEDARLWANGNLGDFGWRISMDFAENEIDVAGTDVPVTYLAKAEAGELGNNNYEANLQDAYASWNFSEAVSLTWGRYRAPRSLSSTFNQDSLLFTQRTVLGDYGYRFDEGVMISGRYDGGLNWYLSAQNGVDGTEDDLNFTARMELMSGNGASKKEGAYDASNALNATLGATYEDDGEAGSYWLVDLAGTSGNLGYHAEFYSFDDDSTDNDTGLGLGTGASYINPVSMFAEDANPWSATLSYLITPETSEFAVRYEDLDDQDDTTLLSFGYSYYMAGHNAKLQFGYSMLESDNNALDGDIISIGLTLGFEGYAG